MLIALPFISLLKSRVCRVGSWDRWDYEYNKTSTWKKKGRTVKILAQQAQLKKQVFKWNYRDLINH